MSGDTARPGVVYLVGAGPGDPGLVTVRAAALVASADVILHDRLIPPGLLDTVREGAEVVYVGKDPGGESTSQDEIHGLLIEGARSGRSVVRLKGGDPFVFGRGGEEAEALVNADVPFEVVPGVTAGVAAPAYAGIPVTHRDDASAVAFVTGHEDPGKDETAIDWEALARFPGTLVLYMGMKQLGDIAARLVAAGRSADEPAAVVERGTLPGQRVATAALGEIAAAVETAGLKAPAVTVIGPVAAHREQLAWLERRPLHGKRVVVTRARAQASGLASRLRELGAEVVELPAIRIEPRIDSEEVRRAVADLNTYALVCLTSANGVELLFDAMAAAGHDARALAGVSVAAIGRVTAEALAEHGVKADVVPERFEAEALAEALADVDVNGKPVLIAAAAGARDVLPNAARARGKRGLRRAVRDGGRGPEPGNNRRRPRRRLPHLHLVVHREELSRGDGQRAPGRRSGHLNRPDHKRNGARSGPGYHRRGRAPRCGRPDRRAAPRRAQIERTLDRVSRRASGACLIAITAVCALVVPASASAVVYVDKNLPGSDANVCTNPATPCLTITGGISQSIPSEEIVIADPGTTDTTYAENVNLQGGRSLRAAGGFSHTIIDGTGGAAITVPAGDFAGTISDMTLQGSPAVKLDGAAVVLDNRFNQQTPPGSFADLTVGTTGVGADTTHSVVIISNTFVDPDALGGQAAIDSRSSSPEIANNMVDGFEFGLMIRGERTGVAANIHDNVITGTHTALAAGIYIESGATPTIDKNTIETPGDVNAEGIHINGNFGPNGATITRNLILDQKYGVYLLDSAGVVSLDGDVIAGSTTRGLQLQDDLPDDPNNADASVKSSTIIGGGIGADNANLSLDSSIVDAAIVGTGTAACVIKYSDGPVMTPGGNGCDDFSQSSAAPGFIGGGNFGLLSTSPLIDAGNPDFAPSSTDINGDLRPAHGNTCAGAAIRDIGAFEFQRDCTPPGTRLTRRPHATISTRQRKVRVTFKFVSTEANSTFKCKIDHRALGSCHSPKTYRLKMGKHKFSVYAVDSHGNRDASPAVKKFKIVPK